ncbi:MAG: glycogen/starch/alpha-glucan phosphorylase [Planctomycetota bacterium]
MGFPLAERIREQLGRDPQRATRRDVYRALAGAAREAVFQRWVETGRAWQAADGPEVAYLSVEFHMGRLLSSSLLALGLHEEAQAALAPFGLELSDLEEEEEDARLGSGGLGRLAACFLDSLATLDLPARGYGLRYELGMFRQEVVDGAQVERPDRWLSAAGWMWEQAREDEAVQVGFGGAVDYTHAGHQHCTWRPQTLVRAVPYDVPVAGYGTRTVGTLRLWRAESLEVPGPHDLGSGDYGLAWREASRARTLTTYLYPPDTTAHGHELRLCQQHLLASATVQDLLRRYGSPAELRRRCRAQLNDTHPVLAIPELLRLLLDEHDLPWDEAWATTREVFAYTNHTLMPEALETWSVELFGRLLPRHLQLLEEIDRRFHDEVRAAFPGDLERIERMSVIANGGRDLVRMAHVGVVGSHHVNGVAELHTRLMRESVFRDFSELDPGRFSAKTNGITPRRWLLQANPRLSALVLEAVGPGVLRDLDQLRGLEARAEEPAFRAAFREAKRQNKRELSDWCARGLGLRLDPEALLDVQVKRFHEYKRQLLLALWVVHRALELERGQAQDAPARTVLFAGKAAATYAEAKRVIRLIHALAAGLERNPVTRDRLRVVFVPDYKVSSAQRIIAAAELSEQISTAGYEASGTGNMKLSLNGALTIGTLDGANVEIRDAVGAEHLFCFGLDPAEVRAVQSRGPGPRERYEQDPLLREVLDAVASYERFAPGFPDLVRELLHRDHYCVLADFPAYCVAQAEVDARYRDAEAWTRSAVLTTARMGYFSSDRTIAEYARDIWRVSAVRVPE